MDSGQALTLSQDAFDGERGEEYSYNVKENTVKPDLHWPGMTQKMWHDETFTLFYVKACHHLCVAALKHYLSTLKNTVMKKGL